MRRLFAKPARELARFGRGGQAVTIALQDEPGNRRALDVVHRRRRMETLGLGIEERLEHVRTDQPVQERGAVHAETVGEVVDAVTGDNRLHRVAGERGHRGDVGARRIAGDRDEVGVHAVVVAVFAQPGNGARRVVDMVGVGCARAQPVIGVGAHPAERREVVAERQPLFALVAEDPAAAVNENQARTLAGVAGPAVDVHRENAAFTACKRHIAQHRHPVPHPRYRSQQQAPRYALDLVEFQFRGDGVRDRRGAQGGQPQHEQHRTGGQRQQQRELAGPGVEGAEQRKAAGKQQREADVEKREVQREEREHPARHDRYRTPQRPCGIDGDRRARQGDQQEKPASHESRK